VSGGSEQLVSDRPAPTALVGRPGAADTDRAFTDRSPTKEGNVQDTEVYQRARAKARHTMTFRLRRQERCLTSALRTRQPTAAELARLAALRSELHVRGGFGRA
jgi:hypothetical protein